MTATHRLPTEFRRSVLLGGGYHHARGERTVTSRSAGFGKQIKFLRAAAGLTQAELAESAGISERTVSDLERGLRGTIYPTTARRLAASLCVSEHQLPRFLLEASGAHATPEPIADVPLPFDERAPIPVPLTRLLGRELEVSFLRGLVGNPAQRLLTLVGPGGIGKTRLAIELAGLVREEFRGGRFFVSLSTTDDPQMVVSLIATAVGVAPGSGDVRHRLSQRLNQARTLLVLDTFEHLLPAATDVGDLLTATTQLTVLATSRAPLHLRGEQEIPVRPLVVGDSDAPKATPAPAVELFIERAAAVAPDFDRSTEARAVVADICARVDGLPLAIELAAAQLSHMTLADLRMQLRHRLDPLVGGHRDLPTRQETMRGALDWSYARLGPDEMRLFRCLAAFRGGFDRTAAAAVVGTAEATDGGGIMPALSALVDSSLVLADVVARGEARYRLLDVTREYATELSVAAGEFDALRRRHADHFLALAERAESELRGSEQRQWHSRLLADEANFRAVLTWALATGQGEFALRLAIALWMFWRWAGLFAEGRDWFEAALAAAQDASVDLRCQGLWGAGWLTFHAGDYRRTDELGKALLLLLGSHTGGMQRRHGLTLVGNAALAEGRNEEAIATLTEALRVCSTLGTTWHLATSELNLGTALLQSGSAREARGHFERALSVYEKLGDAHFGGRVLVELGYAALVMGDRAGAERNIPRAMEMFASLGDGWAIAEGLEAVATLRSDTNARSAAVLGGAAEQLRDRIAMQRHPPDARINRTYLDRARERLTAEEFRDAWAEGRALSPQAALGLALESESTASNDR